MLRKSDALAPADTAQEATQTHLVPVALRFTSRRVRQPHHTKTRPMPLVPVHHQAQAAAHRARHASNRDFQALKKFALIYLPMGLILEIWSRSSSSAYSIVSLNLLHLSRGLASKMRSPRKSCQGRRRVRRRRKLSRTQLVVRL